MLGAHSWFAFQHESSNSDDPKVIVSNIDPQSRLFFFYADSSPAAVIDEPINATKSKTRNDEVGPHTTFELPQPTSAQVVSDNVHDPRNFNLSPAQKSLLLFHQRLAHLRFPLVQSLFSVPVQSDVPTFIDDSSSPSPCLVAPTKAVTTCPHPICQTCQLASESASVTRCIGSYTMWKGSY